MKEARRELMSNQGINPNIIFNRSLFDKKEKKKGRNEESKTQHRYPTSYKLNIISKGIGLGVYNSSSL